MTTIEEALAEVQGWMNEEGVEAVGQGEEDGRPTIDVWLSDATVGGRLPPEVRGFRVRIRESDEFSAL